MRSRASETQPSYHMVFSSISWRYLGVSSINVSCRLFVVEEDYVMSVMMLKLCPTPYSL